nr:hypothetical protein [Clostridium autoethanogenum]
MGQKVTVTSPDGSYDVQVKKLL